MKFIFALLIMLTLILFGCKYSGEENKIPDGGQSIITSTATTNTLTANTSTANTSTANTSTANTSTTNTLTSNISAESTLAENTSTNENIEIISVSNSKEFVEAIGSNREIQLAPGEYSLPLFTPNSGEGQTLELNGLENLSITGLGENQVNIITKSSQEVMLFNGSNKIRLTNLRIGHRNSECIGAVLSFIKSGNITISNCDLFGCGARGIEFENSDGLIMDNSVIEECQYQAVWLENSKNCLFENSKFINDKCSEAARIIECSMVTFNGMNVYGNRNIKAFSNNVFTVNGCKDIIIKNSIIKDNDAEILLKGNSDVKQDNVTFIEKNQ